MNRQISRILTLALLAGSVSAQSIAFEDTTVIDPERGALAHRTVLVDQQVIAWVRPSAEAAVPAGARVIDGRGLFLVPGLIDAHVHCIEPDLQVYLAKGVTTIRELNGSPEHLRLRGELESGTLLGPRMLVASPLMAGTPQRYDHVLIATPEEARKNALAFVEAGYDALKIYDGLSPAAYDAILDVVDEVGLPVTGHIPSQVGLQAVLTRGQNLEHVEKIVVASVGHDFEGVDWSEVARAVAESGVAVTTTLAAHKFLALTGTEAYSERLARPECELVSVETLEWWESLRGPENRRSSGSSFYRAQSQLLRALWAAGVPIIAGTDTPHPLLVPGFGLHEELACLLEAGLPAADVLRAATSTPARVLGIAGGAVSAGARADLLLLGRNPLDDPAHLAQPLGVLAKGKWLDEKQLRLLLAARDR